MLLDPILVNFICAQVVFERSGKHSLAITVKFLNIRTPEKNAVIILKFEQCDSIK